ncbi:HAD hydrolase, family IIID [Cryptococcus sp. DSM 104548]
MAENSPPPSTSPPNPSPPTTGDAGRPPFAQGAFSNSAQPQTKEAIPNTSLHGDASTDRSSKGEGCKHDFASSIFCSDQSESESSTSDSKRIASPHPQVSSSSTTSEDESAAEKVLLSPESTKRAKMSHTYNEASSSSTTAPIQVEEMDINEQMNVDGEADSGPGQEPDSPMVAPVPLAEESEEWWDLKMQWGGKVFDIRVGGNDMVYDFREKIFSLTSIPPDSQKLINLSPALKGKLSPSHDAMRFATLHIKHNHKFILVGTPVERRFIDPDRAGLGAGPEGEGGDGEMDVDYGAKGKVKNKKEEGVILKPEDDPRNKRKIQEMIRDIPITIMNQPREGKGLLVLDLDYTIVDTKLLLSGGLPPAECARPGLHTFLQQVYEHYDIAVWSQTSWRWLEAKLVELGIVGTEGSGFEVSFVCDRGPMFPVFSHRGGQIVKHEVKPLEYIWASYPQWSAKNTVHIDDLSRNFAMNPGSGLKIKAFNSAGTGHGALDRELARLGEYLVRIATTVDDFTTLDHGEFYRSRPRRQR